VLRQRVLTVLIVLPAFLGALFWLPRPLWAAATLVVVFLACIEWAKLAALQGLGRTLFTTAVLAGCIIAPFAQSATGGWALLSAGVGFWVGVVPLWLIGKLRATPRRLALAGWLVLVCAWYALYLLQVNPARLLALLAVVWVADSAAYFAGRQFGQRKLAPSISPGKTWEGVIGAALAVGVYYALLWLLVAPHFLGGNLAGDLLLVGGITVLSVEGDLFESWMKRRVGVKDSGSILPGHGGVLDRIDGVVAVLPLAALAAVVLDV
jgi:phosphatidate cytidylyltransferase